MIDKPFIPYSECELVLQLPSGVDFREPKPTKNTSNFFEDYLKAFYRDRRKLAERFLDETP